MWKNLPAMPLFGGTAHHEQITWGVARVDPLGVGGSERGVTGVPVARLTIPGGRQRARGSLVPGFNKDLEDSRDEAAALLVETEAAVRSGWPLF